MRILIFCLLIFISGSACLQAQSLSPQVAASAGGHFINGNTSLSWTLGEPMTATFTSGNQQLTQGFHQPELTVSAVQQSTSTINWQVYPNPTSSAISINLEQEGSYLITVSDVLGRNLIQQEINNPSTYQIDLQRFAAGNYLLLVQQPSTGQFKTFKIQKIK